MSLNGASLEKTDSRTNDTLVSTSVSIVLQKSRTYDTLVSTNVSIILHNVGLMIHWSRLVYR